jgi:alpha-beta hydrolase superfamily lysophospholipase
MAPSQKPGKTRTRKILSWIIAALVFQFILMNISAGLYAYKLTHLKTPTADTWTQPAAGNIFARTWRLFTGPTMYKQSSNDSPRFACSTVIIRTPDSVSLEAWYGKADSGSRGTVILFHGLMGNRGWVIHEAEAFRNLGFNVLLVDGRNHGNSEGDVTTVGFRESGDVKAIFDWVKQAGEEHVYMWGTSMGAVEVLKSVGEYNLPVDGIIAESPFLSLQSHLKGRARVLDFPEEPFGFLTSFWIGAENGFSGWGFNLAKYGEKVHCPVLLQYGRKDPMVSAKETGLIYAALAAEKKKLVIYESAAHESFLKHDPATWLREVSAFMQ